MYQYYNKFLSSTCSIYLCILARKGVFLNQIRLRINHDLQLNLRIKPTHAHLIMINTGVSPQETTFYARMRIFCHLYIIIQSLFL